ncbi:MAG: cytochrome d ubiquinol oxidase subunit II [Kineosporiaceae bacterium]
MDLVLAWHAVIVACWVLYFVLEGFDLGVGVLAGLLGRDDHERGAAVRTIGPFWDGNEVWLVAAIGATFAAFPAWYAGLLSGLYLPVVVLLLLLAGRGVAIEFRAKGPDERWRRTCDAVHGLTSAGIVALWGAVLAVMVRGLALGPDGEVDSTGGALARTIGPLLTPAAALGAVLALLLALGIGAAYLSLRITGPVRSRARAVAVLTLAAAAAVTAVLPLRPLAPAAAIALAAAALTAAARREALAFAAAAAAVGAVVVAVLTRHTSDGVLLPSTLDAAWSVTRTGAAAGEQALRLITTVGVVAVPGVLAYQAMSYVVFRRRVTGERVPA